MKKLILILISISFSFSAAASYRVSSAADIKKIIKITVPGDTVLMTNGIWNDQRIVFSCNGTKEQPIVLKAEESGNVILTGSSTLKISGEYLIIDGLYFKNGSLNGGSVIEFRTGSEEVSRNCRLTNTAIEDYNPPDKNTDYKWVSLYGQYNRVDHCYFKGKNHSGTTLVVWLDYEPDYHLIDSNYFGPRPELGFNGGETIRVGTSHWSMYNSFTVVEKNYFEGCSGEREIISNKSCGNIYRYNTFNSCAGTLTLRHGNNCTVESNFFFGGDEPLAGGVRVIGENHKVINNYFFGLNGEDVFSALPIMNGVPDSPLNRYFRVKNALIAFNTFINCRYNIVIGTGADEELSLNPQNSVIADNIFMNSSNPLIVKISEPENFKFQGNLFSNSSPGSELSGFELQSFSYTKGDDNFWKLSGPIIYSANVYENIDSDIEGQSREKLKTPGCDQISDDQISNRPLKSADVGPSWLQFKSTIQNN